MKQLITLFVLTLNSCFLFGQHQVKFNIKYSELYATYDFLNKISDFYPENDTKTAYQKSKHNNQTANDLIKEFDQLRLDYSYFYNQYPQPLKTGFMSRSLIERNLCLSTTITEFKNKSLGIIPDEDLNRFCLIIESFRPIYNQVIFEPNKSAFHQQKNKLAEYVKDHTFSDFFETGLIFYGVKWSDDIPFEVVLLPSLEKNNLAARAFFNIAICEPPIGLKDHNAFFSVAMHEIYHIIYDNQSLALKMNIKNWFDQTNSKNSQYALLLLNEVLATDLGNAYVMEKLNNKIEENDWYANYYIATMAKELYPLVKAYIAAKKPMDENFIKEYVTLYDTKFPQWHNELKHLMAYRYILADDENDIRYIRRTYRSYSYHRSGSPITAAEIENLKEQPITKVVILSKDNEQKLKQLKDTFSELNSKSYNPESEFIDVVMLSDNTKLFIINRYKSTTEALMNSYFPDQKQ